MKRALLVVHLPVGGQCLNTQAAWVTVGHRLTETFLFFLVLVGGFGGYHGNHASDAHVCLVSRHHRKATFDLTVVGFGGSAQCQFQRQPRRAALFASVEVKLLLLPRSLCC